MPSTGLGTRILLGTFLRRAYADGLSRPAASPTWWWLIPTRGHPPRRMPRPPWPGYSRARLLPRARVLFKKIDSLWRGNVGAEVGALTGLGYHVARCRGALPQLRRTVVDGRPLCRRRPAGRNRTLEGGGCGAARRAWRSVLGRIRERAGSGHVCVPRIWPLQLGELFSGGVPATVIADGETEADLEAVVQLLPGWTSPPAAGGSSWWGPAASPTSSPGRSGRGSTTPADVESSILRTTRRTRRLTRRTRAPPRNPEAGPQGRCSPSSAPPRTPPGGSCGSSRPAVSGLSG